MIDQIQSRTIPIQSWGIVLAALITNLGVVIAACIQTGWIGRPSSATVIALPSSRQATETWAIDPPIERGFDISQPAAANTPAYLTGATQGSGQATVSDSQPIYPPPDRQVWIVSEPDFIPVEATAESIFSPKYCAPIKKLSR